jgi:hypothetical protein
MGSSNPPTDNSEEEKKIPQLAEGWRPVDAEVWTRRHPPAHGLRRIKGLFDRMGSMLIEPIAMPFLALGGVIAFLGSFAVAYNLGGVRFFGLIMLGIWGSVTVLAILILEKSGYSRNFRAWDFPLRKILYGIPGLFLGMGFIYFILVVLGHR